jgi:Kef-type K+ transport system membrane component KefB
VCTASLLSLVLKKICQPRVIAEVLGGILLGTFNDMALRLFSPAIRIVFPVF